MAETIRVAIADDHPIFRDGLKTILKDFGNISIDICARDGYDLLDQIQEADVIPDICVLDVKMPRLDGFGTIIQLRKRWPAIKAIALSMYDSELSILKMMQGGAVGYAFKDDTNEELYKVIVHVYNGGYCFL